LTSAQTLDLDPVEVDNGGGDSGQDNGQVVGEIEMVDVSEVMAWEST
jgi:hypothetical protein